MSDILSLDATGQLSVFEAKRIGAVELLDAVVVCHNATHFKINAVVATDLEGARRRAKAIDERRAAGEHLGVLAGLPMTIKDTLDVEGLPASSGLQALLGRSCKDAVAVARARGEGAVIWGKTNVPVMAGDWQSYNSVYGTTNNPWDLTRVPGGSSGGAAAALAVGVTALEIGSDIGGSLRVPASFSGVFSHKPTWGLVPQRGHVPPRPGTVAERDLNVVGPMARSARDLRLLLSVIEEGPLASKAPPAQLEGLKIGLWIEEPGFPLDPEVRAVVERFAGDLGREGCQVESIRPGDVASLLEAYRLLLSSVLAEDMPPAMLANMRRMRGLARLAMGLGEGARNWASLVLAYTASHAEWLAANEVRERFALHMRGVLERHDVIVAPITPVTAFPHDQAPFARRRLTQSDGTVIPYITMLNWISLATACGLPATAFPAGPAASGRPVGVQIIGPRGGDARVLSIAQAIEDQLGGFLPPPAL